MAIGEVPWTAGPWPRPAGEIAGGAGEIAGGVAIAICSELRPDVAGGEAMRSRASSISAINKYTKYESMKWSTFPDTISFSKKLFILTH